MNELMNLLVSVTEWTDWSSDGFNGRRAVVDGVELFLFEGDPDENDLPRTILQVESGELEGTYELAKID